MRSDRAETSAWRVHALTYSVDGGSNFAKTHWFLNYWFHFKSQHTVVRTVRGLSGAHFGFVLVVTVFLDIVYFLDKMPHFGKIMVTQIEKPAGKKLFPCQNKCQIWILRQKLHIFT